MKKILFGLMALGVLAACDDNYDDYAAPQKYDKENAVNIQIAFTPTNYAIDMANDADKDVALFSYTTSNEEVDSISAEIIRIDDGGEIYNDTILGYGKDGNLYISANDVDKVVGTRFGAHNANIVYTFKIKADIVAHTESGDGVFIEESTTLPVKLASIPEYSGGYTVTVNNGDPVTFEKQDDGTYQAVIETTEPNSSILFYAINGSSSDKLGCYVEDNSDAFGALAVNSNAQTINIASAGEWVITLDVTNGTYTIAEPDNEITELYMTGNELGWGSTWLSLHKVNSNWDDTKATRSTFWFIRYFQAGEQFKFSPVNDWKGDFGGNQMTVTDNANAGYTDDGSNCKVENAGWYEIAVYPKTMTLVISEPKVYLCGEIVAGGWNASIPDEANRFTNPTDANGEFVSPAFVNDGNVRMFTLVDGIDWWRTEYNVYDNAIVIRTEGDQSGVWAEAGKKAYLNFTDMTGRIE